MKLISIAVPSYNSEAYLSNCLDALVPFDGQLDVIVVNDGSTDGTLAIASRYAGRYPGLFRVIDKPNGGHGSGINAALTIACAPWFKVVDSDDRLDPVALTAVLEYLRSLYSSATPCDLLFTNYVYEFHGRRGPDTVDFVPVRLDNVFAERRALTWNDMKPLRIHQLLQMHTLIYRTGLLREIDLVLPEKTFYEDNIYASKPFPAVRTIHYLNADLYLYFIGRPDQSVNLDSMIRNFNMTLNITRTMIGTYHLYELDIAPPLRRYMMRHLIRMTAMCHFAAGMSGDAGMKTAIRELHQYSRSHDRRMHRHIARHPMILGQRLISVLGPRAVRRINAWIGRRFAFA